MTGNTPRPVLPLTANWVFIHQRWAADELERVSAKSLEPSKNVVRLASGLKSLEDLGLSGLEADSFLQSFQTEEMGVSAARSMFSGRETIAPQTLATAKRNALNALNQLKKKTERLLDDRTNSEHSLRNLSSLIARDELSNAMRRSGDVGVSLYQFKEVIDDAITSLGQSEPSKRGLDGGIKATVGERLNEYAAASVLLEFYRHHFGDPVSENLEAQNIQLENERRITCACGWKYCAQGALSFLYQTLPHVDAKFRNEFSPYHLDGSFKQKSTWGLADDRSGSFVRGVQLTRRLCNSYIHQFLHEQCEP